MGRITEQKTQIQPKTDTGRVNAETKNTLEIQAPVKSWDEMSFGEKLWGTIKQIPSVLSSFIPPAAKEYVESDLNKDFFGGIADLTKAGVKGAGQFLSGVADITLKGVGGGVLSAYEGITGKKDTKVKIPTLGIDDYLDMPELGEVSSWGTQVGDLEKQGFTTGEARALVGINAYLGAMPLISKGVQTKPAQALKTKITTKEVLIAETKTGIKEGLLGKKVDGTVRTERPTITKTKEAIGKTEEQLQFHNQMQEHLDKFYEGRESILSREDPLNKALLNLTDEELATYSKYSQGFVTVEKPSQNLSKALQEWKKVNQETENRLIAEGVLTSEQIMNRKWKPVEQFTGRTKAELEAIGIEPVYYPYLAEDLLKKSDFIPKTGQRTKPGFLKRFTGKLLHEDNYIKNPQVAIPRNRIQDFQYRMNTEFIKDLRDTFAEKNPKIIKSLKSDPILAERLGLEEWKPSGNLRFYPLKEGGVGVSKRVESYWIPKTIKKELDKFYKPSNLEKFMRMTYDPTLQLWRIFILNLVPRWIYNNFVGNTILSILGKTDPFAFFGSAKELIARTKIGEKLNVKSTREIPKGVISEFYAAGETKGISSGVGSIARETTQFMSPIDNWMHLLEQAKRVKGLAKPAATTQAILRGFVALGKPGGALNRVIENWFRTAMYISKTEGKFLGMKLDKPVPPAEGLRYVNEFLFDYSKLSRTERATFRRALPFWNWTKNITEFAFKFPAKHPLRAYVAGALLQDYVDFINEENQAKDSVKSVMRIKTDMKDESGKTIYINIKSAIPFSDVFRTIPTSFETFGRFLTSNPVSKLIIERAFRLNSFTGQPFTQPSEYKQYDEYGNEIRPLPSVLRHLGAQIPQTQLATQVLDYLKYGTSLKRYDTGQPKIFSGKISTDDIVIDVLKYFGIPLSLISYDEIQKSVRKKTRGSEAKQRRYDLQSQRALEYLKSR